MCGITGYICKEESDKYISLDILTKMRDALIHRGPDDCGVFISSDKKIGIGHRRLSILDLSEKGRQPMTNEDRSIWITYNGEIYNYQSIKKELIQRGHQFISYTDTEVIIHAYEEFGTECLNFFEGMFAFALYDKKKKKIILARDRFGIKPIYYGFIDSDTFAFASELKSFVANPSFDKKINYSALGEFFKYRYIPAPKSIWENIFKLTHGHFLEFDTEKWLLKETQYYNLIEKIAATKKSTLEEVDYLFKASIKKRLISDVEVGTLLSGGIDSGSVTALANEIHPGIKSFTIGFNHIQRDEAPFAKEIANYLGVEHYSNYIEDLDEDIIFNISYFYDEPFGDNSLLPTYILSNMTKNYVKVSLSGDGGDEVFSGYIWYEKYNKCRKIKNFHRILYHTKLFNNSYQKLLGFGLNDHMLKKVLCEDVFIKSKKKRKNIFNEYSKKEFRKVRNLQYIDMNTFLVDQVLAKVDRASMANSLEVRVPMLDHKLVESVFRLSETDFPSDSIGKPVLKKMVQNKLPKTVFSRPKKGFGAPWSSWNAFNKKKIYQFLVNGKTVKNGIINKDFIRLLFNKDQSVAQAQSSMFLFYMFESWFRTWL